MKAKGRAITIFVKSTSASLLRRNRNKEKEKETLEKSQEFQKHSKIQQNLKVLNAYIKKIRKQPNEELAEIPNDELIKQEELNKTERMPSKRSDLTKRNRRANNRSRLYEDEQKLFDDIMKHKNNQSLDTKIDQKPHGHLKYTTLLSKDKKLSLEKNNKTAQNTKKQKEVSKNKYYSAPVSTKDNGDIMKFKFHDKKNDTQKTRDTKEKKKSTGKDSSKKDTSQKVTPVPSESQGINIINNGIDLESDNKVWSMIIFRNSVTLE